MKKDLTELKNDRAGRRFRKAHQRAKKSGLARGWMRIICVGLAIVSTAVGIVLIFIPGPAFVFFILAGALVASQWLAAARVLDKAEVKTWKTWKWAKMKWNHFRKTGASPRVSRRLFHRP